MFAKNDYHAVCGDWDFNCLQNKYDLSFIIVDRNRKMATKTDDCILKVKRNLSDYKWEPIV